MKEESKIAFKRSDLLDKFKLEAAPLSFNIDDFLARLVKLVPERAFDRILPEDRINLVGDIDAENADDFLEELLDAHYCLDINIPIEIVLSTDGGDVCSGSAIISELSRIRREGRPIHIHVAGFAFSIGFDILQSADERTAEPTASLMVHHEHFDLPEGSSSETHKREGLASMAHTKLVLGELSKRTGRPVEYYLKKIEGKEWYLSPKEALSEGLIDAIVATPPFNVTAPKVKPPRAPRKKRVVAEILHGDDDQPES